MLRFDLRCILRSLRHRPVFTIASVLTIALGIGANTAVFSVIYSVLVRSLPYREPDRLAHIWQTHPTLGATQTSYPDYIEWRDSANSFEGMAAYTFEAMNRVALLAGGEPEQVQATMASHNLFSLMGITPTPGRSFSVAEEAKAEAVVLISERLWKRRFGRDPSVIGRPIRMGPRTFVVIGVVPETQTFPLWSDLWIPLSLLEPMLQETRRFRPLEVVARLKDSVRIAQAQAELSTIASNIGNAHPETNQNSGASVVPLHGKLTADARPPLLIVWMAAGLLLLIACVNVAHLVLVRTLSRRRELAIRLAVGASTGRIARLLAIESGLIVILGGLLGSALAGLLMPTLRGFASNTIPRVEQTSFDPAVWLYTLAAGGVVTLIVALPSVLAVRRADLSQAIRVDNVQLFSHRGNRLGSLLMASEVALGFVTFVTALLLVRSFLALVSVQPGFDGSNVLAIDVSLSARDRGWEQAAQIFETSLLPELARLPGVQTVATANAAPMSLERTQIGRFSTRFGIPGVRFDQDSYPAAQVRWVSEDYFDVLGIPLLRGRLLLQSDRGKPLYLINETLATRFFPAQDPVGKHLLIDIGSPQPRAVEVAGVVGDVRDLGLDLEVQPTIYSISTSPVFTLLVRSTRPDLAVLTQRVKEVVHRADSDAPVARVRTVDQAVSESLVRHRFALWLMIGFAGLTAVLLVVGIYGVIAYLVGRSARDFGIRAALGGSPADLLLLVIRKGLLVSLIGLAVGFGLSWVSSKLIGSVLFNVSPTDPLALAATVILLLALCVLSMLIPARRAAITDPAITLRQD